MKALIKKAQAQTKVKYREIVVLTNKEFDNIIRMVILSDITQINKSRLIRVLEESYPAYLAPSLMLFSYKTRFALNCKYKSNKGNPIGDYQYFERVSSAIEIAYMENILHSIRNLAERVGNFLNLAHPEISYKDGIGFINENKPDGEGPLNYALLHKENNYMQYLIDAYYSWISKIKKSDNYVKHNKNLKYAGLLDWSIHNQMPYLLPSIIYDQKQDVHYSNENIDALVRDCYDLINRTIQYVIKALV